VLSPALEAEALRTPEERFAATKPAYEAMIAAGFLRKCIPISAGGENAGLTDTAIMAEELYAANASVTLTLIGTVLGLLPVLIGGGRRSSSLWILHAAKGEVEFIQSSSIKQSDMRWRM
jgi:butyryl-CoA dehydrogenase